MTQLTYDQYLDLIKQLPRFHEVKFESGKIFYREEITTPLYELTPPIMIRQIEYLQNKQQIRHHLSDEIQILRYRMVHGAQQIQESSIISPSDIQEYNSKIEQLKKLDQEISEHQVISDTKSLVIDPQQTQLKIRIDQLVAKLTSSEWNDSDLHHELLPLLGQLSKMTPNMTRTILEEQIMNPLMVIKKKLYQSSVVESHTIGSIKHTSRPKQIPQWHEMNHWYLQYLGILSQIYLTIAQELTQLQEDQYIELSPPIRQRAIEISTKVLPKTPIEKPVPITKPILQQPVPTKQKIVVPPGVKPTTITMKIPILSAPTPIRPPVTKPVPIPPPIGSLEKIHADVLVKAGEKKDNFSILGNFLNLVDSIVRQTHRDSVKCEYAAIRSYMKQQRDKKNTPFLEIIAKSKVSEMTVASYIARICEKYHP